MVSPMNFIKYLQHQFYKFLPEHNKREDIIHPVSWSHHYPSAKPNKYNLPKKKEIKKTTDLCFSWS